MSETKPRALIEKWQGPLYNYARGWLGNEADAADATQDILIELLRDAHQITAAEHRKAWVYRVASRVLLKHRKRRRRRREVEDAAPPAELPPREPDLSEAREQRELVARELKALPERCRSVLLLKYYQGLTQHEVAAALELPRSTVQSQIKRGLEMLRERLSLYGLVLGAPELEGLMAAGASPVPAELAAGWSRLSPGVAAPVTALALGAGLILSLGLTSLILVPELRAAQRSSGSTRTKPALADASEAVEETRAAGERGAAKAAPIVASAPKTMRTGKLSASPDEAAAAGHRSPENLAAAACSDDMSEELPFELIGRRVGTERLAVRVVDRETGAPVSGATVRFDDRDFKVREASARTDVVGRVSLPVFAGAMGTLGCSAPGYGFFEVGGRRSAEGGLDLTLDKATRGEELIIELLAGSVLAGRVVDPSGAVIEARVSVIAGSYDHVLAEQTTTGGRFEFTCGAWKRIRLHASHERFASTELSLDLSQRESSEPITLTMERSLTLRGRVVDSRGVGVPGALIRLRLSEARNNFSDLLPNREEGNGRDLRCDAAGVFEARRLRRGRIDLMASAPGFEARVRSELVLETDRSDVVFRLDPGGTIEGRVVDPAGAPIADVRVSYGWRKNRYPPRATRSDARGAFRIEGLRGGAYVLEFSPEGDGPWGRRTLDSVEAGGTPLLVELGPRTVIAGRFIWPRGARPAETFELNCWSGGAGGTVRIPKIGEDGRFRVLSLLSNPRSLTLNVSGYVPVKLEPPFVDLEIHLVREACVKGRVVLADGGPIGPFSLRVFRDGGADQESFGKQASDGRFEFQGLPPGRYRLVARRGEDSVELELALAEGQTLEGLTLTLPRRP